jgi:hypothetical protein
MEDLVKSIVTNVAGRDNAKGDGNATEAGLKSNRSSKYERNKAKNIAKLKQELAKLNEQYPIPKELKEKAGPKKSATKKKGKTKDEVVTQHESQRNKSE